MQVRAIDRSVRGKKKNRELYYRGEEKHREKRDERQIERERFMGRGDTRVSDSKGVKTKERKSKRK